MEEIKKYVEELIEIAESDYESAVEERDEQKRMYCAMRICELGKVRNKLRELNE